MKKQKTYHSEEKFKNLKIYSIIMTILVLTLIVTIGLITLLPDDTISETEAKNKALEYGNFKKEDITFLTVDKEYDDKVYEITFKDKEYKYEMEIHMTTGEVINFEKDAINQTNITTPENDIEMTEEEAKEIALSRTNQKEKDVKFTKVKLDKEDNRTVYELEFYTKEAEYEINIDVNSKEVVKYDIDYKKQQSDDNSEYIGIAKAQEIALNHAKLNEKDITWHKTELDVEYKTAYYEIEFTYQNKEYEYEINATNGNIIKYEIDK